MDKHGDIDAHAHTNIEHSYIIGLLSSVKEGKWANKFKAETSVG
jgi:hypothetical protein